MSTTSAGAASPPETGVTPEAPAKAEPRIAVVFIHGQGEQRPMEDVQELARTVWSADPSRTRADGSPPQIFLTPDETLGLADLGRVTTEARAHNARVDFYELYWAHLMSGNKLSHLADWFKRLQARPRKDAPRTLLPVRQTVIRFIESLALLAILFVALVGLMTPPDVGVGLDRDTIGRMWSVATLGALPPALLAGLPGPEDLVVWLGISVAVAVATALASMLYNEWRNGAPVRIKVSSREKLANRGKRLVLQNRVLTVLAGVVAIAVLGVIVLQGPFADWADTRVFLLLAALLASVLLTARKLEAALLVALTSSAVALVVALFGGLGGARDIAVSLNAAPPALLFVGQPETAQTPAQFVLRESVSDLLSFAVMSLALFAVIWFVFGLVRAISGARYTPTRVVYSLLAIALGVILAATALDVGLDHHPKHWAIFALGVTIAVVVAAASLMFWLASEAFLVPVMADSARYFSRDPAHVRARQSIRQTGLRLLERLHERPASQGGYSRVIVVAHSLGTAVGYELLIDYWGRKSGDLHIADDSDLQRAVRALEAAAQTLNLASASDHARAFFAFRSAQTDLQDELLRYSASRRSSDAERRLTEAARRIEGDTALRETPRHWLITDFITLGSPLTHASLLMADSPANLVDRFADRTLSTCPPIGFTPNNQPLLYRDDLPKAPRQARKRVEQPAPSSPPEPGRITFQGYDKRERFAHHACFAPVRWTNHYFPTSNWIAEGDVIGGPLGPDLSTLRPSDHGVMGRGVHDKALDRSHTGALFAHNEYWRSDVKTDGLRLALKDTQKPWPMHIAALIASMALDEKISPGANNGPT